MSVEFWLGADKSRDLEGYDRLDIPKNWINARSPGDLKIGGRPIDVYCEQIEIIPEGQISRLRLRIPGRLCLDEDLSRGPILGMAGEKIQLPTIDEKRVAFLVESFEIQANPTEAHLDMTFIVHFPDSSRVECPHRYTRYESKELWQARSRKRTIPPQAHLSVV